MPTSATTMLHIRVDQNLKTRASETLDKMGLSLSDAVRLLLTRIVVEEALPFEVRVPNAEVRVPNAETRAAMEAGDRGEVSKASSVAEMMTQLDAND